MWVRSQEEEENSRRRREQERNDQAEAVRIVTFRDWIQAGDSGDEQNVAQESSINTDRDDQTQSPSTYEEYLEEGSKKDPPAYDVAVGDDRV